MERGFGVTYNLPSERGRLSSLVSLMQEKKAEVIVAIPLQPTTEPVTIFVDPVSQRLQDVRIQLDAIRRSTGR